MRPHQPEEMLKCPGSAQFASYGLDTLPQVAGVKISKVTPYRTEQAQHPAENQGRASRTCLRLRTNLSTITMAPKTMPSAISSTTPDKMHSQRN